MSDTQKLVGKLVEGNPGRDAIHVAVIPIEASMRLFSGERVALDSSGKAARSEYANSIGVVDPFLADGVVMPGQRFWLFLYPGSITSLRHVWTHPALEAEIGVAPMQEQPNLKDKAMAESWLRMYATRINPYLECELAFLSLIEGIQSKRLYIQGTDVHCLDDLDYREELESFASVYFGIPIRIDRSWSFSCSC